jgi:hypothetical protein
MVMLNDPNQQPQTSFGEAVLANLQEHQEQHSKHAEESHECGKQYLQAKTQTWKALALLTYFLCGLVAAGALRLLGITA